LAKEVITIELGEDINEVVKSIVGEILGDTENSVLIFVYRRNDCRLLAEYINKHLCSRGEKVSLPYHSGMSSGEREHVRKQFLDGGVRCFVTTTALAMGVNLPATHVLIRDTTFWGTGKLSVAEMLQMLGRAGRGRKAGHGMVLIRTNDKWEASQLSELLKVEEILPIKSSFETRETPFPFRKQESDGQGIQRVAEIISALLLRYGKSGQTDEQINKILGYTLAGEALQNLVPQGLAWLANRLLAYKDENHKYHLTRLGERATQSVFPAKYAAGLGQLIRDLLEVDVEDRILARWSPVDHLIVLELMSERTPELRRFSESLADQIDGRMEGRAPGEKSVLFVEWIRGLAGYSRADELLGSLDLAGSRNSKKWSQSARKYAYMGAFRALVLDELSRGSPVVDIERVWGIKDLEGLQERWRDNDLWLLSGLTGLYDIKCFFFHLCQNCQANTERIQRVKACFGIMRGQVYDVMERIKYCSPLGPLMKGVRGMLKNSRDPKIGFNSIKKLEAAGIANIGEVAKLDIQQLVQLGLRKDFAKQVRQYVRRRML
jgi:helicase